jgi:hypothetical protein
MWIMKTAIYFVLVAFNNAHNMCRNDDECRTCRKCLSPKCSGDNKLPDAS